MIFLDHLIFKDLLESVYTAKQISLVLQKSDWSTTFLVGKVQKYYYDLYSPKHMPVDRERYDFLVLYDFDCGCGHCLEIRSVTRLFWCYLTKTFSKIQFFEEVLVLFKVLFDVLFLPAMIACDLTPPTHH